MSSIVAQLPDTKTSIYIQHHDKVSVILTIITDKSKTTLPYTNIPAYKYQQTLLASL